MNKPVPDETLDHSKPVVNEIDLKAAREILRNVAERDVLPRGGLIPPPEFAINQRIDELEKRIEAIERRLRRHKIV